MMRSIIVDVAVPQLEPQPERRLPPELGLVAAFYEGLRALHIPGEAASPRELSHRVTRQKNARRTYCRGFLTRLERKEADAASRADLLPLWIARATARLELARNVNSWKDFGAAQALFHQALANAERTGRSELIYRALKSLGHFYREALWQGDSEEFFEAAIWYYKEALVHAHGELARVDVPDLFYWIGVTYALRDETLAQAVSMFDWASRFDSDGLRSLIERQKCRLRLGEREALLRETKPLADPDPADLARAVVTMQVLGRRGKQVRALAEQGLALAAQREERRWQSVFEAILKS